MIKDLLSRYRTRYPRSLVYMLQASEYHLRDYFRWYHKAKDFAHVERRKSLVRTPKAVLLLVLAWIVLLLLYGKALFVLLTSGGTLTGYLGFLFIVLIAPYILPYIIVIPLLVINLIQLPVEGLVIRSAKKKLAVHKGFKIGIAGSFGKTSMREILKTVLSEGEKVATPPHNYNTPLGISQFIKTLKGDEEVLVFEFGEYYPGDIRKLCELVRPQMGIITGVNEAHLEKFKSMDQTTRTIFELADWLRTHLENSFQNKAWLYINGESEPAKKRSSAEHILYNREGAGGWKVQNPHTDLTGTNFVLIKDNLKLEVKSKLLGLHQIGPLAAAADIASRLGLSPEAIKKGIENTEPFDHRLEPKTDASGAVTLDDSYNGNPDGVKTVIEFLASLKDHRRFYVTPGLVEMGARTEAVHKEIGKELAEAKIENVILIKNSVTGFIEQGLRESHYEGNVAWFDDALAAFAALPHLTVKGDVVLLQNDWPDQYQ